MKNGPEIVVRPENFEGGVAIWGALAPLASTYPLEQVAGVHVHARRRIGGPKEIDDTFERVTVVCETIGRPILLEATSVTAFNLACILEMPVVALRCRGCGEWIDDLGSGLQLPLVAHSCICGATTETQTPSLATPVIEAQRLFSSLRDARSVRRSEPPILELTPAHLRGGAHVWASNDAVLWSGDRTEDAGLHVHVYVDRARPYERLTDDTYASLVVGGQVFSPNGMRLLMAQLSVPALHGLVGTFPCNSCGASLSDVGPNAYTPSARHHCQACGSTMDLGREVVCSPAYATRVDLQACLEDALGDMAA